MGSEATMLLTTTNSPYKFVWLFLATLQLEMLAGLRPCVKPFCSQSAMLFRPALSLFFCNVPFILTVWNIKYITNCCYYFSVLQMYFHLRAQWIGSCDGSSACWILQGFSSIPKFNLHEVYKPPKHWGHFWCLHLKKDKVDTEKVHRQATAMIKGTEELLYQEKLQSPRVFSLKRRSLTGDMI